MPHCDTNVSPCEESICNVQNILHASLPPLPNLRPPAHGYQLDTYHWANTMPDSARTCSWTVVALSGERPKEKAPDEVCEKYP